LAETEVNMAVSVPEYLKQKNKNRPRQIAGANVFTLLCKKALSRRLQ